MYINDQVMDEQERIVKETLRQIRTIAGQETEEETQG